jgi:four helix bundle protein
MVFIKNKLAEKADIVVRSVYSVALTFPQIHQFSIGEQLRRASLSIVLNIVESGGRIHLKEKQQLLNVSYGSLKETQYLVDFSFQKKLITVSTHNELSQKLDELARIIYTILYKENKK